MVKTLSVVTSLYRSEHDLPEVYARCRKAAAEMNLDLQMVMVNDASPDHSLRVAQEIASNDPNALVIDLARNYGQHKAVRVGLQHATGDLIAFIDSDLEDDPLWLPMFWQRMQEEDADVAYGERLNRKGNWLYRLGRDAFNRLLELLIGRHLPRNATAARLMTRRYLDGFLAYPERDFYLLGLCHDVGFHQIPISVAETVKSPTTYSLTKLLGIVIRGVTSFSIVPLTMIFVVGTFLSFAAAALIFYLIFMAIFMGSTVSGWASLMAAVMLIGGMTLMFNGIMAMYISTIFLEVKDRPVVIREKIGGRQERADDGFQA